MWIWLIACQGNDGTTDAPNTDVDPTTPAPEADPNVDSYVPPDNFPPQNPEHVIYFGDSITAGFGITNEKNVYTQLLVENNGTQWPDYDGRDLDTEFPGIDVTDVSISGATTDSVITDQLPLVEDAFGPVVHGHTIVMGTIAGNDIQNVVFSFGDQQAAKASILANLKVITDFFQDPERFPDGVSIAITNVYEPTDGTGQAAECFFGLDLTSYQPYFDDVNASTRAQAVEDGWAWVDLRGHFAGHGFNHDDTSIDAYDAEDPTLWFQDDCIHPNVRGHHEVRRLFLATVDGGPLFVEPPPTNATE